MDVGSLTVEILLKGFRVSQGQVERARDRSSLTALPPSAIVRTKWGTPFSCTATLVRSASMETIASGPSIPVSGLNKARIIADDVGSMLTGFRPAAVVISIKGSTRSR